MKAILRILSTALAMLLLGQTALAAPKTTPTPRPMDITEEQQEPPEMIQQVLDLAYAEWAHYEGKKLKNPNKFTEWRGKGIKFGWCGGYITWCMIQANVPMETLDKTREQWADGVVHVKEASVASC